MKVLFLWHMHQPAYSVYEEEGLVSYLPWVFLHSLREYYEMPAIVEESEDAKVTFNLVPSLLEQMEYYATGKIKCLFTEMVLKRAEDLTPEEKTFILHHFFDVAPKTRIYPYERYKSLYLKRENSPSPDERAKEFTSQEIRDIQFYYIFSYISPLLIEKEPLLREFLEKKQNYSEEDKKELVRWCRNRIPKVIELYRKLLKKGKAEISTTPFYHPIMPLLYDSQNALKSKPGTLMPSLSFSKKENVELQVKEALNFMEEKFGCRISGMWPSEGSVSEDIIPLLRDNGIRWIATDEEILYKSLKKSGVEVQGDEIYRLYRFDEIYIFFRDRELSDRISFVYSEWNEKEAAEDFVLRLESIARKYPDGIISIILDGENAWENYPQGGLDFLKFLYGGIRKSPCLEFATFTEIIEEYEGIKLEKLHPGSWINGDFSTWIGHPEKNIAWEYLIKVKNELEKVNPPYEALKELMRAEGSDWFWWYGDTNFTLYEKEFDMTFRRHLIRAMELASLKPFEFLNTPIILDKGGEK